MIFYEASTDMDDDEVSADSDYAAEEDDEEEEPAEEGHEQDPDEIGYMHLGRIPNSSEVPNHKPRPWHGAQTHLENLRCLCFEG